MRLSSLGFVLLPVIWTTTGVYASAQDPHSHQGDRGNRHAENHDWYKELKQPGTGLSCCNARTPTFDGDCRPTRAYMNDDGRWYALIDGRWIAVPPRAVLQQLAPDGRSHVCANKNGLIHCFLGGSPKI